MKFVYGEKRTAGREGAIKSRQWGFWGMKQNGYILGPNILKIFFYGGILLLILL